MCGAVDLSHKFKINPKLIGLTLVAVGTSLPEITITIIAASQGSTGLVVGNIFGSNVFNILAVAGVSALFGKVYLEKNFFKLEIVTLLLVNLLLLGIGIIFKSFNFVTSFLLLLVAGLYFYKVLSDKKINHQANIKAERSLGKNILLITTGIGLLAVGSKLSVDFATKIAEIFNLAESFVGVGILAVGTGLPELTTSLNAAKKGHHELSFGNILGSNVVNLTVVLAIGSGITNLALSPANLLEIALTLLTAILFFGILLVPQRFQLKSRDGLVLIAAYILYFVLVVNMGRLG